MILAFELPFCATLIHYAKRRNLIFIGDIAALVMVLYSVFFLIDRATFMIMWQVHPALVIYHYVYGGITFLSVYVATLLITRYNHKHNKFDNHFKEMNKCYCYGMMVFVVTIILMIYVIDREYFKNDVLTNFIPLMGTIKTTIKNRAMLEIIRNFGNAGFFTILSVVLCEISSKDKTKLFGILLPTALSVFMEIYQLIFRCGDFDVDDIIINVAGALVGYLIYKSIILKIKEKELW